MSSEKPFQKPFQKRSLSQVFLKSELPGRRMIEDLARSEVKTVLEIGPGSGVLTKQLIDAGFTVVSIEKDREWCHYLKSEFQSVPRNQIEIIHSDILKIDLESLIKVKDCQAIVGNIPYKISSPICELILDQIHRIKLSMIMVQKEFAERLAAEPGTRQCSSLSIFAQLRSNVTLICEVPRALFSPVPAVDSAVVKLTEKTSQLTAVQRTLVEDLARILFQQRRKMLRASLKSQGYNLLMVDAFDVTRRPESLTLSDWLELTRSLHPAEFSNHC